MGRDIEQLTIQAKLEMMSTQMDQLELTVRDIDEAIRGNGQPGIHTRLALHDHRLEQTDSMMQEIRGLKRYLFLGVLSLLGSLVWQAIQYLLQQPLSP